MDDWHRDLEFLRDKKYSDIEAVPSITSEASFPGWLTSWLPEDDVERELSLFKQIVERQKQSVEEFGQGEPAYLNVSKKELKAEKKKLSKIIKKELDKIDQDVTSNQPVPHSNNGSTVLLKDGRRLGYKMFGSPVSRDCPYSKLTHVFIFHGTPGSRFFLLPSWEQIGIEKQIRFHVIERPGFGLSDSQPDRTLLSFCDDVLEYADQQNIDKFRIIGYSAGSPYALMCAYHIPKERLLGVVLCAAIYPSNDASRSMSLFNKIAWNVVLKSRFLTSTIVKMESKNAKRRPGKKFWADMRGHSLHDDVLFMHNPSIARLFAESVREQYSDLEKGVKAEVEDYMLFRNSWNLNFGAKSEATLPKVHIINGSSDQGSTCEMAKYLHENVPGSTLNITKDEGHLVLFGRFREVVETLVSD